MIAIGMLIMLLICNRFLGLILIAILLFIGYSCMSSD